MKRKLLFPLLAVWVAGATVRAADYTVDANHSKILFRVKHLGIANVTGRFEKFTAAFSFDPTNPAAFSASASIEAPSVNTDVTGRDDDLRSANFFDVANHPKIEFVSSGAKEIGKNKYEIAGNLTIRGVTKPVVLMAEFGGTAIDPRGNERAAFSATGVINRKDFGITWNRVLDTGGVMVGDEVQLIIEVEGIKKKATS
jgi:polyisoprenoid-binding protein YceI